MTTVRRGKEDILIFLHKKYPELCNEQLSTPRGDSKYVLHESMKRRWAFKVLFDKERKGIYSHHKRMTILHVAMNMDNFTKICVRNLIETWEEVIDKSTYNGVQNQLFGRLFPRRYKPIHYLFK